MDNILFSKFIKRVTANLEDSNLERVILQELGLKDFDNLDAKLNKVTTEGLMDFFKKDEELQKQLKKLDYEEKTTDQYSALIQFFGIKKGEYDKLPDMYHLVNYPIEIGYRIDSLGYGYAPDLFNFVDVKKALELLNKYPYKYKNQEHLEGKVDDTSLSGKDKYSLLCFINKESITYIELTPHVEEVEHYDDQVDKTEMYKTVLFKFALRTKKIATAKDVTIKRDENMLESLSNGIKCIRKMDKKILNADIKKDIKYLEFINESMYMSSTTDKLQREYQNSFDKMFKEISKMIDSFTENEFKYLR